MALDGKPALTSVLLLTALTLSIVACGGGTETAPPPPAPAADSSPVTPEALTLELPDGAETAAQAITADVLREAVRYLADDELEGRGPGSAGDEKARRYIADQLQASGLQPGGVDGTWEQPFGIVGITAEVPETWSFKTADGAVSLAWWEDFIAGSGVQEESAAIDEAEVVFVGYGIVAPEHGWDDYAGADLKGKLLLMLNNDPDWDPDLFAGERRLYYGRWSYKYESAAAQGAAGAIIIHTDPSAGYPWQVVQTSWSGEQFELPAGDEPRVQVAAWTSYDATDRLLAAAGHDLSGLIESAKSPDFAPVPLGITTSLQLNNKISSGVETANVLGLLPGSDPTLKDEVVIFTAHHDHLGRGKPNAEGDDIYNGALDNASGVAQVLAIARAMQALPTTPRRSILFNVVAAEEQGLLGSKYYAANPTFPAGRIAAAINFDAGNIWGRTRDIVYIGYGKSSLDQVIEAAAAQQERKVVGDQFPDKGFFYRSDQFSLAKIGVPALYLDGGTELIGADPEAARIKIEAWNQTHYHQPSDELTEEWNFEGMVDDAKLGFSCALHLAMSDAFPAWNPGDEFEAARLDAIAALPTDG